MYTYRSAALFGSAVAAVIGAFASFALLADDTTRCSDGARCFRVVASGKPDAKGAFIAQCSGQYFYPDFVDLSPSSYGGPRFQLSQQWPTSLPNGALPWTQFDFRDPAQAQQYLRAILKYAYDDLLALHWRAALAKPAKWFHVPWMTAGAHPREFVNGMTEERPVTGPELGVKAGVTVQNAAVGLYNDRGGFALGQFWSGGRPHSQKAQFPEGTAVIKVLGSDATKDDFSGDDILDGAPTMAANIKQRRPNQNNKKLTTLRVLQIDVAVKDSRANPTGWVFGTFAYDKSIRDADPWQRMQPVGLMWGNDPALTPAVAAAHGAPHEGFDTKVEPQYAKDHLGWLGRVNGPVDNPKSACLSCHSTAQSGNNAPMTWDSQRIHVPCTDAQKMAWFRNLKPTDAFGEIEMDTCKLLSDGLRGADDQQLIALDFSLQQAVAFLNANDKTFTNPCAPPLVAAATQRRKTIRFIGTDRVVTFRPLGASKPRPPASKNRYPIER